MGAAPADERQKGLINVHLTRITLALITALLKSGAQVEVTVSGELVTHQNTLQTVLAAQFLFTCDSR